MEIIMLLFWAFAFSCQLGKREGKWGCFTALIILFLLGAVASLFD